MLVKRHPTVPPVIVLDPYIGRGHGPTFRQCSRTWDAKTFLRERGIYQPKPLRTATQ